MGHECDCVWLDVAEDYPVPPEEAYLESYRNIRELEKATLFILDTIDESITGGREVEFGIALHRGIKRWRIGPIRNIFHTLTQKDFNTWEEVLKALETQKHECS